MMSQKIEFTRVKNDVNGNPRYVCHYTNLLSHIESGYFSDVYHKYIDGKIKKIEDRYNLAINRAKKIGGRKFNNKQYGGGIVFQSYNISETERQILELVKTH